MVLNIYNFVPNEPWEKESLAVIATSTALETQFLCESGCSMWLDSPAAPMASHFLHGEDEEDIDEPLRRLRQRKLWCVESSCRVREVCRESFLFKTWQGVEDFSPTSMEWFNSISIWTRLCTLRIGISCLVLERNARFPTGDRFWTGEQILALILISSPRPAARFCSTRTDSSGWKICSAWFFFHSTSFLHALPHHGYRFYQLCWGRPDSRPCRRALPVTNPAVECGVSARWDLEASKLPEGLTITFSQSQVKEHAQLLCFATLRQQATRRALCRIASRRTDHRVCHHLPYCSTDAVEQEFHGRTECGQWGAKACDLDQVCLAKASLKLAESIQLKIWIVSAYCMTEPSFILFQSISYFIIIFFASWIANNYRMHIMETYHISALGVGLAWSTNLTPVRSI